MAERNSSSASSSRSCAASNHRERRQREDLEARVLGDGVSASVVRQPLGLVDLAQLGQCRRQCSLVVGLEPAVSAARRDAQRLAEQLLRALQVALGTREPAELQQRGREHGLDAELLSRLPCTSSIIVCAASSSPLTLRNPAYASVALIRARTLPLSPASSRARVSRSSASSSSRQDHVPGRQCLRGNRLEILPSGVERLHVRALHVAHVVLARSEPDADHRARHQCVEVGDGVGVGGQDPERLVDELSALARRRPPASATLRPEP